MMYRGLKWKKCPLCKSDNLWVETEELFNTVKEKYGESPVEISCECGCQLWVYSREVEVNDYKSMIVLLNSKWNKRGGKSE